MVFLISCIFLIFSFAAIVFTFYHGFWVVYSVLILKKEEILVLSEFCKAKYNHINNIRNENELKHAEPEWSPYSEADPKLKF